MRLLSHISIFNLFDFTLTAQTSLTPLVIPYQGRALPTEPYQQMKFLPILRDLGVPLFAPIFLSKDTPFPAKQHLVATIHKQRLFSILKYDS